MQTTQSESSPLTRIGIIGCGYWGPNHLRVFSQLDGVRVTACADRSPARLATVSRDHPALRCFAESAEMLAANLVDAVVVSVPTNAHYAVTKEALLAGKHVLCEKPLCNNSREAEELVALAESKGLILMVGHIFLFNPALVTIKKLIETGEIGQIRYLSATRTNLGPVRSDVNAAWDLASHDVATFNWLLGSDPEEVSAMGASYLQPGIEDIAVITMRYPGNILGTIQSSWLDPKKVRRMTIVGSRRMITWDDMNLSSPVAIYEKGIDTQLEATTYGEFLRLSMWEGDVRLPKIKPEEPLKKQAQAFLNAIQHKGPTISDGRFALRVVRVLERAGTCMNRPGPSA